MSDETVNISAKSWARTVESINKTGYSDGVVDGQKASFQSSFDMGYNQGFELGFSLGLKKALDNHNKSSGADNFSDARRINCQICLNSDTNNGNIVNLYNRQQEKNNDYLNTLK